MCPLRVTKITALLTDDFRRKRASFSSFRSKTHILYRLVSYETSALISSGSFAFIQTPMSSSVAWWWCFIAKLCPTLCDPTGRQILYPEPPGKPLSAVQGVIMSASPKLFSFVIFLLGFLLSFCIFPEAEVLMEMLMLP